MSWHRLPPGEEHELAWFFVCADAAVGGLRSPSLEPREVETTATACEVSEARLQAVERAARIARALRRCSPDTVRVLRAWCGPATYLSQAQMRTLAPLGRSGPVMLLTRELDRWAERELPEGQLHGSVAALDALRLRVQAKQAGAVEQMTLLRQAADESLRAACEAYTVVHEASWQAKPARLSRWRYLDAGSRSR